MTIRQLAGKLLSTVQDILSEGGDPQFRDPVSEEELKQERPHWLIRLRCLPPDAYEFIARHMMRILTESGSGNVSKDSREEHRQRLIKQLHATAQMIHPEEGCCDAQGPGGVCSECYRVFMNVKQQAEDWSIQTATIRDLGTENERLYEGLQDIRDRAQKILDPHGLDALFAPPATVKFLDKTIEAIIKLGCLAAQYNGRGQVVPEMAAWDGTPVYLRYLPPPIASFLQECQELRKGADDKR